MWLYNIYKLSQLGLAFIISIPLMLYVLYVAISLLYFRYIKVCSQCVSYVVKYNYMEEGYCRRVVFYKEYTYDNIIYSVPYVEANEETIPLHEVDLFPGKIKINCRNPVEVFSVSDCKLYRKALIVLFILICTWCTSLLIII